VLNDVLSFNRMESGKFAQARKPFDFHKSIQLVALSHRMQAQMAGIELNVELDKDVDKIGGMFIGDEMRLRQVASNLVSNSIKFTDTGSVRIVTKLLYPRMDPTPASEIDDPLNQAARNSVANTEVADRFSNAGDVEKGSLPVENRRYSRDSTREREEREERNRHKAVVRVEVHDTGVGLKKQDVIE
jgi:signal transduction histidine kinase